ncbi:MULTISPECIES: Xaa-Pro peptidase family protein [Moorena]|uniref:Xaa-Pro aminopeptidase n=1 Tax=Moorena producens 3L TaxID=489825 RepID=F4XYU1_9CYAN|nr:MULTISPECIES: Xaa-Pro peptidase family protein [Moorena]EGJ30232.1 Xaa-Pro aminopeptidase [Moorena producens 3L]NEP34740.1 aminopeptidase P family protein [Moorena sp. SIO3B2]NEP65075.1 aminopeptidase P family protein [Moorena sp. SIO3A5]NER91510.1 aminopeptidase P family protein [Moorena sp. SIO3A2]NES40513.1 aminopeptidase P family protein [Moorena sp. SIO2C4]
MIYNLERLKQQLDNHYLDIIIAATRENILYLTGFNPVIKTLNPYYGQCYVVITRDNPDQVNVVHSIGEIDQLLDAIPPLGKVYCYGRFYREYLSETALTDEEKLLQQWSIVEDAYKSPVQALEALLTALNAKSSRIGYDQNGFSDIALAELKSMFSKAQFVESSEILRFVRRVKTSYEVEQLTRSAQINERAIAEVLDNLYENIPETEISRLFEVSLVKQGAYPSLTMVKIGRHAVGGQRRQREDIRLAPGDLLWFDSDAWYQGFWSDIARVYAYREVSPAASERYHALALGMKTAISEISPGMTGGDVFNLTMAAIHEAGFREYRRHHVGHGIGLEPYERPILAPSETERIEAGMVISVETPFYEFGFGALHIEDPILIGNEDNHLLTNYSIQNLIALG